MALQQATVARIDEFGQPIRKAVNIGDPSVFAGGFGLEEKITNPALASNYKNTYTINNQLYGIKIPDKLNTNDLSTETQNRFNDLMSQIGTQTQQPQTDTNTFTTQLNNIYGEIQKSREDVNKLILPTEQETLLGEQLAQTKTNLGKYDIETQRSLYGLEGQGRGITSDLVAGEQEKLQRQRALDRQSMALDEANLINRLGLAQEARKAQIEAKKAGLSSLMDDANFALQVQERLDAEKKNILDAANNLRDDQRALLTSVLEKFKGIDPDKFDANTTQQLAQLSAGAGIPFDLVVAGLRTIRDQQGIDNKLLTPTEAAKLGVPYGTTRSEAANMNITPSFGKTSTTKKTVSPIIDKKTGNVVSPEEPDYLLKVIRNSKGGKQVDVTAKQQLGKSLNVIGQLSELKENISGEETGPIVGILRSANPYDVKAQQIKAQLQAIVPNLAKGVYGEVGVLTDNDVALYSRTLPNIKSVEELRNAVLGMTLRTVQRSIENQFEIEAGLGRDVSGLENVYTRIKKEADKLNSGFNVNSSVPEKTNNAVSDYITNTLNIQPSQPSLFSKITSYITNLFSKPSK